MSTLTLTVARTSDDETFPVLLTEGTCSWCSTSTRVAVEVDASSLERTLEGEALCLASCAPEADWSIRL
jgi:hypothetical protein